jgi:hypothetical protein
VCALPLPELGAWFGDCSWFCPLLELLPVPEPLLELLPVPVPVPVELVPLVVALAAARP